MSLPPPAPDRAAVITGASSGIGTEIARELHRRGHQVALVARSADTLDALAKEFGPGAHALPADLADRSERASLLDRVADLGFTPDVLINNAGLSTVGPVWESAPDAELNMIEVDVAAVADLCTRFLPGMIERGTGAVLNVASTAAFQPVPGQAGYSACKAFVLSYTQSLSAELRGTGVSATVLCPGPVDTGFDERAGFTQGDAVNALPSFMWVSPTDVAKAAVDGMARGRLAVIPGVANRVAAQLAQFTPRSVLLPFLARTHPGLASTRTKPSG
ncbi:MAG TPA: SDR family oxidoreductase [Jatrophihabitans sp.]|jgi:short-subunit dehydrogenase|nr:SDR family oxidoreductase [Jatrophihabitans sp.]